MVIEVPMTDPNDPALEVPLGTWLALSLVGWLVG